MSEKLKSLILNDQIFFGSIIILVGICSFGLGRASVMPSDIKNSENKAYFEEKHAIPDDLPIVTSQKTAVKTNTSANEPSVAVVASKTGSKYHLETCPGAKQIKEANLVKFSSISAAEAAGYKPAANCPDLQ